MTTIRTTGICSAATLLVAIGAAIFVAPALAAAEDDCEPQPAHVVALERVHFQRFSADVAEHLATIEAVAVLDVVDAIDVRRFKKLERRESHPMTRGIAVLAAVGQLPGRLAIGAQHAVAALAKATPRVLRAIL